MSNEQIVEHMIDYILEQEREALNTKQLSKKKKDFVGAIIKELNKEVENENKKD